MRRTRASRFIIGALALGAISACKKDSTTSPVLPPTVKTVVLSPAAASLEVGATLLLTPTLKDSLGNTLTPSNYVITWSSSDTTKAIVSVLGVAVAVAPGTVVIKAAVAGLTASASIVVPVPVASVTVSPATAFVLVGGSLQLAAVVRDSAGNTLATRAVSWTSSSTSVASLTPLGLVTGLTSGTVTVTASSGNKTAFSQITVGTTPPPAAQVVTLSPTNPVITAGGSVQLTATDAAGAPITPGTLTWTSSNAVVAAVTPTGLVSALAAGSATVTATRAGGSGTSSVTVNAAATRVSFTQVSAGDEHSCGIVAGSPTTYCWGNNAAGQLGTGTGEASAIPVPVGTVLAFTSVSSGWTHSCALTAAGSAFCWGDNGSGQVGDGTTTSRTTPVAVTGGLRFTRLSAGYAHSCGITAAGTVWCWGSNIRGQLGSSSAALSATPVLVAAQQSFTSVSTGGDHTCALTGTGGAWCWGGNTNGQLGTGLAIDSALPAPVAGGISFSSVAAGSQHSCGIARDGTAYCWGRNDTGELGNGSIVSSLLPVPVTTQLKFTAVAAGELYSCAIAVGGAAFCWGDNLWNELGGARTASRSTTPVSVSGNLAFTSLSAGFFHACGMTITGTAYCWGDDSQGQNGDGMQAISSGPVKVAGQP